MIGAILPFLLNLAAALKSECAACKELRDAIAKNLVKTYKQNFGGGNTKWEEKSLGPWLTSETRMIQTIDYACKGDFKCSTFLENYEEEVEEWFKSGPDSAPEDQRIEFYPEICVKVSKACCESETQFGKKCKECPTGINGEICYGRGKCEGAGDRAGKGTCKCDLGYKGLTCNLCEPEKYFMETVASEDEKPLCSRCNIGCKGCNGRGPDNCIECAKGWILADEVVTKAEDAEDGQEVKIKKCVRLPSNPGVGSIPKTVDDDEEDEDDDDETSDGMFDKDKLSDSLKSLDTAAETSDNIKVSTVETDPEPEEESPPTVPPTVDPRFNSGASAFDAVDHDEF